MKKTANIRNLIIVMLCVTIIFLGIGFAYLALVLENDRKEKPILEVTITKIVEETPIKGGLVSPTGIKELKNSNKTLNFNFIMYTPQDELTYTITVENTGNQPAKIEDIVTYPDYLHDSKLRDNLYPITITHNDLKGKVLSPEDELELRIVVTYNQGKNVGQVSVPYQMTVLASSVNK